MQRVTKKATARLARYLRFRILALGVLGGLLLIPYHTAMAQCVSPMRDGDFESQRIGTVSSPWVAEGSAGIDIGRSLSYHGRNNAWARNNTGWNAIRQTVRLSAGVPYTLKAFVRTSDNVRDGYFGFRNSSQRPVSEIRFGSLPGYRELSVRFSPARTGTYNIFTGLWAPNQDAWIQVDYLRVEFPCDDVILNPVDQ